MTTLQEKAAFIGILSGSVIATQKNGERLDKRSKVLDKLLGDGLPPTEREDLRKAMTFKVESRDGKSEYQSMDERGQRKSIETEDARLRYKSIQPADYAKVQAALEKILRMKDVMLKEEDSQGKPLFDEADLMKELFAPLVREGLMPENLVIDDHSETAQLLKNTYASYLKMIEEARKARQEKDAKASVDIHGAGSKLDVLKALGTKAQGVMDAKLGVIANKVGLTPDEMTRLGSISMSSIGMVGKGASLGLASSNLALTTEGHGKTKSPTEKTLTKDSGNVLKQGISDGIGIATVSKDHLDSQKAGAKGNRNQDLKDAATAAALMIDQAVCDELIAAYPPAMGSLDGRIANNIDTEALVEAVLVEKPQAASLTAVIAKVLEAQLSGIVTSPEARKAFETTAKKLATEYGSRVNVGALIGGLKFVSHPVEDAFDPLVAAAAPAAKAAFGGSEFREALKAAQTELIDTAALNNEALTQQLEQSESETEEFERQLILVDEGGADMARQRSIAVLIGQLEKDRLDLEIVLKVGSLIGSFGGSVVTLGVDSSNFQMGQVAGTVATTVGQSLVPALKAAQLVMQMSVTIIQIARRAEIAAKFNADVTKARKAGSPLLPAVENFYSSKVAQQTFASIELALQTVQLAGAICSSVPEPITMATGKLLGAIGSLGSGANDLAEKLYTHQQLEKGWNRTLFALNNVANRAAGLDALRSNGTLAVHAVAWAATEGGDPIAQEILNSCGVTAQTLADSASDQDAVITYMETLLHEDIQFKDKDKIKTKWAPSPLTLTYPGWFSLLNRARTEAPTRLSASNKTPAIDQALKVLDLQPKVEVISKTLGQHTEAQLSTWIAEAETVVTELEKYKPITQDVKPHLEMVALCANLVELATDRVTTLKLLLSQRQKLQQQQQPGLEQGGGRSRSNAVST